VGKCCPINPLRLLQSRVSQDCGHGTFPNVSEKLPKDTILLIREPIVSPMVTRPPWRSRR
jgi:hypothetical protein